MKIEDLIIEFANQLSEVTEKYKIFIHNIQYCLYLLENKNLEEINQTDISNWVTELKKTRQPKTVRNIHCSLSSIFNYAVSNGYITTNLCKFTKLPRQMERQMVTFTKSEFQKFIDCVNEPYKVFVYTLFLTGARFSEVTALTMNDIDFDAGVITINKSWGDGEKYLTPPKTDKSNRIIFMSKVLHKMLLKYIKKNEINDILFTNCENNRIRNAWFRARVWLPALKKMKQKHKINKYLRIHDARHTYTTWLLSNDCPIYLASNQLGHESIETTVKRYGHIIPENKKRVIKALKL
jgi:integrase